MGIYNAYTLWNNCNRKELKELIEMGTTAYQFKLIVSLLGHPKVEMHEIQRIMKSEALVKDFKNTEVIRQIVRRSPRSKDNEVYWCKNNQLYFNDSYGLSVLVDGDWLDAKHNLNMFHHSVKGVSMTDLHHAIQDYENIKYNRVA